MEDLYLLPWRRLHKARRIGDSYQTLCGTANKYFKAGWYSPKPLAKNDEAIYTNIDLCVKCFKGGKYKVSAWLGVIQE